MYHREAHMKNLRLIGAFIIHTLTLLNLQACDHQNNLSYPSSVQVNEASSDSASNFSNIPLLVVQIEFSDQLFHSDTLTWHNKIFGSEHSTQLNYYWKTASKNDFQILPAHETQATIGDGVVTITLNQQHPNCVGKCYPVWKELFKEAIELADTYVNFNDFDANNNSQLEQQELQVLFIVAGTERAITGTGVHAHSSRIYGIKLDNINDILLSNKYSAIGEKHDLNQDASIGVIAHELGHSIFNRHDIYKDEHGSKFSLMGRGVWSKKEEETQYGSQPALPNPINQTQMAFNHINQVIISNNSENNLIQEEEIIKLHINDRYHLLIENRSCSNEYVNSCINDANGLFIWKVDNTSENSHPEIQSIEDNKTQYPLYYPFDEYEYLDSDMSIRIYNISEADAGTNNTIETVEDDDEDIQNHKIALMFDVHIDRYQ